MPQYKKGRPLQMKAYVGIDAHTTNYTLATADTFEKPVFNVNSYSPKISNIVAWSFAMVVLSKVILSYGQNAYAGFQFGLQGEGFCDMMTAGFMTAALSLSSNAIGAKNKELYEAAWQRLGFYCRLISLITSLFLLFFSKAAISLQNPADRHTNSDISGTVISDHPHTIPQ